MFPIVSIPILRVGQITGRLDALWQSHIKNHDIENMLPMGSIGAYSSWVSHLQLSRTTTQSRDNLRLLIGMCSIDMETGVMRGITISFITGIDHHHPDP